MARIRDLRGRRGGGLIRAPHFHDDVGDVRQVVGVDRVEGCQRHHSAAYLAEPSQVFGRLDLYTARPGRSCKCCEWGCAGMLAGMLLRLTHLPKGEGHGRRFLNDALLPQA
ncbi:MAG: hypothetical protein EOS20_27380 [Mesorhizobium sp.]|nr:MAG: hypothetical protein EOS20_27380 [Mesorhizobium sp.]